MLCLEIVVCRLQLRPRTRLASENLSNLLVVFGLLPDSRSNEVVLANRAIIPRRLEHPFEVTERDAVERGGGFVE